MAKKKISYDLFGKLQLATIEREVEDAWNGGISLFFTDSPIEHPFACDGFLADGLMLRLIIEYKFSERLSVAAVRARILVQVLFYLKRFEEGGLSLPNVIMVADKNECFVIHTNDVQGYLDKRLDWSMAPSCAADCNPALVAEIAANDEINPFIFVVGPRFDLSVVVNRIRDLAINVKRYVRVTEHNIAQIFEYYTSNVLRDARSLPPHELVESFLGVLLEPEDYYQHPSLRNALVTKTRRIPIYGDAFQSFFDFYYKTYTPQEKMKFTEITDRLVEDVTRRRNGEFFTPTVIVDYAHRMIERTFGERWKEDYVVWDCCCGTKNLTRDYRFSQLYCSTLNEEDLRLSSRYNTEAESFQFDFLNDNIDELPSSLRKDLETKPLFFIINPPFLQSPSGLKRKHKTGSTKNMVNADMLNSGIGNGSRNMYTQFLWRFLMLKNRYPDSNISLAFFSPTLFLSGNSFSAFRERFLQEFRYLEGVQFKASFFSDVSNNWGISFSLWSPGETVNKDSFDYTLIDVVDGNVVELGRKKVYNTDRRLASNVWVKPSLAGAKVESVYLSNPIRARDGDFNAYLCEDAIGGYVNSGNNVDKNSTQCYLLTGSIDTATGAVTHITRENFRKVCAVFAARKLIAKTWINSKDEYLAPDITRQGYAEYEGDSIVFSLFHASSGQSSLRDIHYKGRLWSLKNEFFWVSKDRMVALANKNNNMECYADARTDTDRYVYMLLRGMRLSPEANAVLRKAVGIVEDTFPYRELFNQEYPEFQVNNWDCGWYQIHALASRYDKKGLSEFKELFDALCNKMRPKVYEFGFLED